MRRDSFSKHYREMIEFAVVIWSGLLWALAAVLGGILLISSKIIQVDISKRKVEQVEENSFLSTTVPPPSIQSLKRSRSLVQPEVRGCRAHKDKQESSLVLEATFGLPRPITSAAGYMVDLATRDFVLSWYKNTSSDPEFLEDAKLIMLDVVGGLICRAFQLDFPALLVKDVAPILRRNVANFHRFHKIAASAHPQLFYRHKNETVGTFREREREIIEAGLVLHPGATDNGAHAQVAVLRILRVLLATSDANCLPLIHLIREIIVRSIVLPALESLHPFCVNSGLVSAMNAGSSSSQVKSNDGVTSESVPQRSQQHDGRIVETFKAGKDLLNHTLMDDIDEDCCSSVTEPLDQALEENHFVVRSSVDAGSSVDTEAIESELADLADISLTSVKITKPDLSLDYSIPSDPVPYMSYTIEVRAVLNRTKRSLAWTTKTRYSKLKDLHSKLHRKFPTITAVFPRNRGWKKYILGLPDYDKSFVDARTRDLHDYMSTLMRDPYVKDSRMLKKFFLGEHKLQTLIAESEIQVHVPTTTTNPSDVNALFPTIEQNALATMDLRELYLLIEEVFMLDHGRFSFFRSNIISFVRVIVKTAFKGSLFSYLTSISDHKTDAIADVIVAVTQGTWPNGELAPPPVIPPESEQTEVQQKALQFLKGALPAQVVSLIGAEHRDLVAENCHEMLQYHLLTKSIFLEILDVIVARLFPADD